VLLGLACAATIGIAGPLGALKRPHREPPPSAIGDLRVASRDVFTAPVLDRFNTNATTMSGVTTLTASTFDNIAVVGVQFLVDGANLGAEDSTSPYSVTWDTTTVPDGPHVLSARARDAAGNTQTAPPITVTVQNGGSGGSGPVAAYGFNESGGTTADDSSPTGNDGALVGATWAAGRFGSAVSFTGAAYVQAPDVNALSPGSGATFAAWIYLTSTPSELASIVNKWSQTADDEYLFAVTANRNPFFAWHTTGGTTYSTPAFNDVTDASSQVPLNTWTHVAVVRNGASLSFYVNGTLTSSTNAMDTNPFRNGSNTLRVGSQSRGGVNRHFPGRIDELRIYSRALTAAQLQADMNAPIGSGGDTVAPTVTVTSPTGGSTVGGTPTVAASASDNVGVAGVQFKLDGANLGAEDTTSPYAVAWNTTTASNGTHTLTAVARDAAGNTRTSAAVTVTVSNDSTAPTVSLTAPANGATVLGTVAVSATASDNAGVVGVQFKLDGANLGAEDTTSPFRSAGIPRRLRTGSTR
jgi:hypothetical protein